MQAGTCFPPFFLIISFGRTPAATASAELRGRGGAGGAAAADAQGHVPDAEQAIARHPFYRPLGGEAVDAREQLGEREPDFHAREARAETDVGAEAEGDVAIGRAR